MFEDIGHRANQFREEDLQRQLVRSPEYSQLTPAGQDSLLRVLRAHDAEAFRAGLIESATKIGDTASVRRLEAEDRTQDSLRRSRPPPRPSDWSWYQENCYEGKPR